MRFLTILLLAFTLLGLTGLPDAFAVGELEAEVPARIARVAEFDFIRKEAEKMGVRVWLFGGTAAGFGHYVKWDLKREGGDTRFQPDRFDYDYSNIYRSTQDLDIVIDGSPAQVEALQETLEDVFPHFQGSRSAWEVRSLREKVRDKEALLQNPDFLNQHTDSNSTGMIEITKPKSGEPPIRDLRAWDSKSPAFLTDLKTDKLHFYFSPSHFSTNRAKEGLNPPILSALRYLTKAFQYELEVDEESLKHLKKIIAEFDPKKDLASNYARQQLEKNAKKIVQHAVNLEYARSALDELGLRKRLIALGDPNDSDSMAWWLNKKPLESKPVGSGQGKTAADLAKAGKWPLGPKGEIIVSHETNNFLAYESITRAHTGEPNVFISRKGFEGEAAAYGNGFYTRLGKKGARNTGITIRFTLDPKARLGNDFSVESDYVIVKNKDAIRVIPESLNLDPVSYFRFLVNAEGLDSSDTALMEKLRRRMQAKMGVLTPETINEMKEIVRQEITKNGYKNTALLKEWFRMPQSVGASKEILAEAKTDPTKKLSLLALQTGQPHWEKSPFFADLSFESFLRGLAVRQWDYAEDEFLRSLMNRFKDPSRIPAEDLRKGLAFMLEHARSEAIDAQVSMPVRHWFSLPWASEPKYTKDILLAMEGKPELHKMALRNLVRHQRMDFLKNHPGFIKNAPDWATSEAVQSFDNPSVEFLTFLLNAEAKTSPAGRIAEKLGGANIAKQPGWAELVNRLVAAGNADKTIAGWLGSIPEAAKYPEWFETILARGKSNDALVTALNRDLSPRTNARWMNTLIANTRDFSGHDLDAHIVDALQMPKWRALPEWRGWINTLLEKPAPTYRIYSLDILRPEDVDALIAKQNKYAMGSLIEFLMEKLAAADPKSAPEFRDQAWIRGRVEKILSQGHAEADLKALRNIAHLPQWKNEAEWVGQIVQRGSAAKYLAENILSEPASATHPEWLFSLLTRASDANTELGDLDAVLDQYVLNQPHWKNHPRLLEITGGKKMRAAELRVRLRPDDAAPLFALATDLLKRNRSFDEWRALASLSNQQLEKLALAPVASFDEDYNAHALQDLRTLAQRNLVERKNPGLLDWLKADLGKVGNESLKLLQATGAADPAFEKVVLDFWKQLQPINTKEKQVILHHLVNNLAEAPVPAPASLYPIAFEALAHGRDNHPLRYNAMKILKDANPKPTPELRAALLRSLSDDSRVIRDGAGTLLESLGEDSPEYHAKLREMAKGKDAKEYWMKQALERMGQVKACPLQFQALVK